MSTNIDDKVPGAQSEDDEGLCLWRRVTIELDAPYFLLRLESNDDDQWAARTQIMAGLGDLIEAFQSIRDNDAFRLTQVAMIGPPSMTNETGWCMHDLDEIKAIQIDHRGNCIGHFKTRTGQEFADPFSMTPMSDQYISQLPVVFRSDWFPGIR